MKNIIMIGNTLLQILDIVLIPFKITIPVVIVIVIDIITLFILNILFVNMVIVLF